MPSFVVELAQRSSNPASEARTPERRTDEYPRSAGLRTNEHCDQTVHELVSALIRLAVLGLVDIDVDPKRVKDFP
jgi:hypothetical protein